MVKDYNGMQSPTPWKEISLVPYAEVEMGNSPFWKPSHIKFRSAVREFLWTSGLYDWADSAETSGELPTRDVFQKFGKSGLLAMWANKGPHLMKVPEPNLYAHYLSSPLEVLTSHLMKFNYITDGANAESRRRSWINSTSQLRSRNAPVWVPPEPRMALHLVRSHTLPVLNTCIY